MVKIVAFLVIFFIAIVIYYLKVVKVKSAGAVLKVILLSFISSIIIGFLFLLMINL